MLSANEIKNVRFSKSMGGYKQEEVDVLLDKVESDYELFERTLREMNAKITSLKAELEESKNAQGNIQNVLVSAQKFADQIVEEAKTKSAEIIASAEASIQKITAQEAELTTAFDKKASERKSTLESDLEKIVLAATEKQTAVENATQDCINRQQLLFDKMKIEIAAFKAEITNKYKEHLELLASLPDTVPSDPSQIAAAVSLKFDGIPDVEDFVSGKADMPDDIQTAVEASVETQPETTSSKTGFVINTDGFDIDGDTDSELEEDTESDI